MMALKASTIVKLDAGFNMRPVEVTEEGGDMEEFG